MALPPQDMPAAGPNPGYVKLVANRLKNSFKGLPPNDPVEISQPRWVQTIIGWNWLTCVHLQVQGHPRTYAVFFNNADIVDSRYAVETDGCGEQVYSPLDLGSGTESPAATGEQGPLY